MKNELTPEPWKYVVVHSEGVTMRTINGEGPTLIAVVAGSEKDGVLMAMAPQLLTALKDLIEASKPHIMKLGVRKGYHEMVALTQAEKIVYRLE